MTESESENRDDKVVPSGREKIIPVISIIISTIILLMFLVSAGNRLDRMYFQSLRSYLDFIEFISFFAAQLLVIIGGTITLRNVRNGWSVFFAGTTYIFIAWIMQVLINLRHFPVTFRFSSPTTNALILLLFLAFIYQGFASFWLMSKKIRERLSPKKIILTIIFTFILVGILLISTLVKIFYPYFYAAGFY